MQILDRYKNKKIAILGFGIEGLATFEYLEKHGILATILDKSDSEDIRKAVAKGAGSVIGENYLDTLPDFDIVFKTPGISPLTLEIQKAVELGAKFTSQIEEFFAECPCKIIGVTGTKGKGTTSTLIHDIMKRAGKDVYLGGNIGIPAISFLDDLNERSVVVLELSSFQLQVLRQSPHIAVLLNTTSEHLDYHVDTAEYRDSKANIVKYQSKDDFAVISADYDVPKLLTKDIISKRYYFSRFGKVDGCYVDEHEDIRLSYKGKDDIIANTSEVLLRGRHNLENITAAALASSLAGADAGVISAVIREFHGLEHRLELVRSVDDVNYYDDSFSTVPETAIAALNSFTEPIVLIAGGSSKNSDYTELGEKIADSNLRALILIGATAEEIERSIPKILTVPVIKGLTDMREIVDVARNEAKPGDVVLLSPACASKGLFLNYKDRGDQFKAAVKNL